LRNRCRFDGFVARHHGDGAVVYFGYPHAHEDDAERAVQASLALVQAVAALPTKEKIERRVGVATASRSSATCRTGAIAEEHGILGDTPNLAARCNRSRTPAASLSRSHKDDRGTAIRVSRSR
jgi:class 3 adenylate cyclase